MTAHPGLPPRPAHVLSSGTLAIPLCSRAGVVRAYALVDPEFAALANETRWCLSTGGYARRKRQGANTIEVLHRLVMGLEPGDPRRVDHINGNKLDNRRANLRLASQAQNMQNVPARRGTSKYRGVYRSEGRWRAGGRVNGREHYIGTFDTERAAADAATAWRAEHLPFANEDRSVAA